MHPERIGVILGFFILTLLNKTDFAHGKAVPEDNDGGTYKYRNKQELGTQFQPFYSHQSFPPKNKLYYTPLIDGQPIYIPAISGSASQTNKLLRDYYERNKEYTQSWTLATPAPYDYGHGNQRDYYEDPVTSYSMVNNLPDGTYEGGVHHGSYHILPITPGSHPNYGSEQTNKDFKVKNKSNKLNLRKRDKKKKLNKDFLGLSTKNPVSVNYEAKSKVSDYAPEVTDVVGPKLLDDDDYAPEVVDVVGMKLDDDYAPEVVDVVGTKLDDDDYAPEVADVVGTKLDDDDDYAPEVADVVGMKLDDDYSPEVVDVVGTKLDDDDDYAPEVVDVVNTKMHGSKKLHLPKTEAVKNLKDDSDEAIIKETFTAKKDKTKVTSDKKREKNDKKREKMPSSSSIKTVNSEVTKSVNNKSDKQKNKKQSQFVEKHETSSEPNSKHTIKDEIKRVTEHLDTPYKTEKIESSIKSNADANKKSTQKIKMSTAKPPSKYEYVTDKIHKVIKRKDISIDDSESPLDKYGKTESSSHESTGYLSEGTALHEDKSSEKPRSIDSHEVLLEEEPFNTPVELEAFDLENLGSGEDIRRGPLFNIDSIMSLSSLNSNIWSLIFNPTAELRKLKKCVTRSGETGFCMYAHQCDVPNLVTSLEQLLNNACVIDDIFIGICCPEFPVQSVKVQWEQMPSNSDKRTEDEFGHNAEDCGIRSDGASKARSWPWKAPLVSMSNGKIFCGGVVINEDYILTAAHCTTKIPKNQILVRLGQHDDSSGEDFAVVEIKRHAQYNPRTLQNDIALLKLGRRIVHDEYTDAVCLPEDDEDDDDVDDHDHDHSDIRAVLLGWQGSFKKNFMKDEILEVMTHDECEKKMGVKVPATLLCTEARNVNERTCNADSGAPLIRKDGNKYEVIGILSWNRNDCDQRFPSTFSRVSKYVRWIKKHGV